jgi:agmatinase
MSKFMSCDASLDEAKIVLFGAGFDGTVTNRPGARFAPAQIRIDSFGLENYSPYFDREIEDCSVFDGGDLDLPFGNTEMALRMIEDYVRELSTKNKKSLMIGGEHLITLPAIKSLYNKYKDLCIIHFDAHCDLRQAYLGVSLSHSTVMYHCWELLGDDRIFQFGIRSGTKEEFLWANEGHTHLTKYNFEHLKKAKTIIGNRPVYLSVDLDVLDPSVFPGTGTPEPGGVTYKEFLEALHTINGLNIIGADVLELSPHYDMSGISTAAACKAIREVMCIL